MSRTPEVMISKPRKFAHDVLVGIAVFQGLLCVISLATGGNFLILAVLAAGFGFAASRTKYTYVKTTEAGRYELV